MKVFSIVKINHVLYLLPASNAGAMVANRLVNFPH